MSTQNDNSNPGDTGPMKCNKPIKAIVSVCLCHIHQIYRCIECTCGISMKVGASGNFIGNNGSSRQLIVLVAIGAVD